jgi:hypothetical protein
MAYGLATPKAFPKIVSFAPLRYRARQAGNMSNAAVSAGMVRVQSFVSSTLKR